MLRFGRAHFSVCLLAVMASACSGEDLTGLDTAVGSRSAPLRDLSASEASEDLEQIFTYIRTFYGPAEYKEARFGYSIDALEDEARALLAAAPGDDGFYAAANWFLTRLDDGHVALVTSPNSNPIFNYVVGIFLQPVEGKALVAELFDPSLADLGIAYGDEVLTVDGISPFDQLDEFLELDAIANDLTNEHLIYHALIRPGFAASIRPVAPTAHVEFRRADGSEYARDLIWREDTDSRVPFVGLTDQGSLTTSDSFLSRRALEFNTYAKGSLATIGSVTPFFLTAETSAAFDITPVTPNAEMQAKYGLDPTALPDIFAALYSHAGKSILLIRQSSYDALDELDVALRLQYYRAILDQYDGFADALVVDQTHNPGGFIDYCTSFARLFMKAPGGNFVQAFNPDRTWINDFRDYARTLDPTLSSEASRTYELRAELIEQAYDSGANLTAPIPFDLSPLLQPDDTYVWQKPLLVLTDELAGSCGDAFPMLIKNNGTAPIFGRRTMGLGGNVEPFGPLPNSAADIYLTRGMFTTHRDDETYPPSVFIENNGVQPDIEHVISAADFRAGFVDYMTHFSDVIAAEVDAANALPAPPESPHPSEMPHPVPE
jgi:peptidase S41-like protein